LTKLDDLRAILHNKNKPKDDAGNTNIANTEKQEFSLEVAGSESSRDPMASFGTDESDPDLVDQLYLSPKNRPLRGDGATYWDQE